MPTERKKINILGVLVDPITVSESIDLISGQITKSGTRSMVIIKPYVKFLVQSSSETSVSKLLNQSDLCLADGISLQWAASYLYAQPTSRSSILKLVRSLLFWIHRPTWISQIIPERGAGADATIRLLRTATNNGWRVGVITGLADQKAMIRENLENRFKNIKVAVWPGYFEDGSDEEKNILNDITRQRLDILFVGRGFPLQEKFILAHQDDDLAKVLIAEGGTFAYNQLGGKVMRAPQLWRRLGLEWLWRSFAQPEKISNLLTVLKFINLVNKQAKKQK